MLKNHPPLTDVTHGWITLFEAWGYRVRQVRRPRVAHDATFGLVGRRDDHDHDHDGDRGDIILGWLTKLVLCISILGVIAFDGVSIGVAHVSAVDDANSAALAASRVWQSNRDMTQALAAAQENAAQHGETVVANSLHFDSDGTAHLDVRREATTLIVRHIHPLKSWLEITAGGSGRSVSE